MRARTLNARMRSKCSAMWRSIMRIFQLMTSFFLWILWHLLGCRALDSFYRGRTPLLFAVEYMNQQVFGILVEVSDVTQAPHDGFTALHAAAENGERDMAEVLLGKGAGINKGTTRVGATPLYVACWQGHEGVVRLLLAHAATDVNQATTDNGITPLNMTCQFGHEEVVQLLLTHAATDVDQARRNDGLTPLFVACQKGHKNVVLLLLKKGADGSKETAYGTVLSFAEQQGHKGMVALLSSPIPIGSRVELRALQAKPELNGRRGVVKNFNVEQGRCVVQLVDGDQVMGPHLPAAEKEDAAPPSFKLKPENLVALA